MDIWWQKPFTLLSPSWHCRKFWFCSLSARFSHQESMLYLKEKLTKCLFWSLCRIVSKNIVTELFLHNYWLDIFFFEINVQNGHGRFCYFENIHHYILNFKWLEAVKYTKLFWRYHNNFFQCWSICILRAFSCPKVNSLYSLQNSLSFQPCLLCSFSWLKTRSFPSRFRCLILISTFELC